MTSWRPSLDNLAALADALPALIARHGSGRSQRKSVYWVMVFVGFGINLLILGPRRFFLMDIKVEEVGTATNRKG